jgi:phosphoribosylanthranilate isomerase
MPDVKFCGMTRIADVQLAAELGARYVGVIFAESPRRVDTAVAREIIGVARGAGARVVGVFGAATADEVISVARDIGLDGVQLHGAVDIGVIESVRRDFTGEIWAVAKVNGRGLPGGVVELAEAADGLLLDTSSPTSLGGTGHAFDWETVSAGIGALRGRTRLIVAGGLRAENVRRAIDVLAPDVVDVSSGIEASPGVKDPERMRAFMGAVRGAHSR